MTETDRRSGLCAGLGAYLIWGSMPVFIKLLQGVSAEDVLAHRILWSAVVVALACAATGRGGKVLAACREPRVIFWLIFSAACIGANWYLYTWAVLNDAVLDTSLGYFIQPLLNTLLGVALLGEKLNRWHVAALSLAAAGIAVMTVNRGGLPLVALGLPVAFALYSLARNRAPVDALTGLLIETVLLTPVALWWLTTTPPGLFGPPAALLLILMASGVVTSVPLALFGHAARRLTLTALGFLQYLAPSIVFLLGVFVYGEPMDPARLSGFLFIWAGLAAFSIGGFRERRKRAKR